MVWWPTKTNSIEILESRNGCNIAKLLLNGKVPFENFGKTKDTNTEAKGLVSKVVSVAVESCKTDNLILTKSIMILIFLGRNS